MDILSFMIMVTYILVPSLKVCIAVDSIRVSQFISDGKTLVSKGGNFELGFFSPGNSNKRYLGIWYKNIPVQTIVWVANRANPINDSSGILTMNSTGSLVLRQNGSVVWNTTSQRPAQNPVAELLDSGNLVVRNEGEANPEGYLWQGFDYPTDTFLAGMKLGWDLRNDMEWRITSWKSADDPSPGEFYRGLMLNKYPEFYLMKGTKKYSRIGPWNGLHFSGTPNRKPNANIYSEYVSKNGKYVSNKDELFFTYSLKNNSLIFRAVINQTIYKWSRYVWNEGAQTWMLFSAQPSDTCDIYGLCGANGNCRILESPVCQCLQGFSPKSPQAWNSLNWTQGCVRNKPLSCNDKLNHGFVKLEGLKVPDTTYTWLDENIDLDLCRDRCLKDCSCMAYTNSDIRGAGSGCVMWFGDLIDIRQFEAGGQDLYIRMPASEFEPQNGRKMNTRTIVATTVATTCGMLLLCIYFVCRVRRNIVVVFDFLLMLGGKKQDEGFSSNSPENSTNIEEEQNNGGSDSSEDDLDLPLFDLSTIASATNNFSTNNKIGQGGFGPVYKGRLVNGKEIAVKRLSRRSGQGMVEFKNEVKLIAKLQHRNLVKLLGCCIQGQEKMLIYEYMPNSSLNSFIFDHIKGKLLDWSKRFHIICGIARGLMYLHQDSRLRIIHRDLKASNVLLDDKLNPKISDFGIAKTFAAEQTEGNTNRVVGTYGYMAPEYAADGMFSVKSDVFSFGILVLEIVNGKRNRGFYNADQTHNHIGHAWMLWKEGRALELIDNNMEDSWIESEVLRCIHVSLLCAQQHPEDRPTMSTVVLMLGSEIELPGPKQPGFFTGKVSFQANSCSSRMQSGSTNEMTMTSLEAR